MNTKEKRLKGVLISLKACKTISENFAGIFLNVYIFKALNSNFETYLYLHLISIILVEIQSIIAIKYVTNKNAMVIYRLSFIFDVFLMLSVIFVKNPTFLIAILFYFLKDLANVCFYVPQEMGEMKATNKGKSNKFLAKGTIVSSGIKIISPFLSGLIIEKSSYIVMFVVMTIVAICMFVLSLFIDNFQIREGKFDLKSFSKEAFKLPQVKNFYISFTFFRLSLGGTIVAILPLVLFMKTGTEFSLGSYSSIFEVVTMVTLFVLMYIKNQKYNVIISIIMLSLGCIILAIFTNFTTFIIFNAIYYMFGKILENETYAMRLDAIKFSPVKSYKREHKFYYDLFANIGYFIGYSIILIFYKLISSGNILTYVISGIGLLIIVSGIYLQKSKIQFQEYENNIKSKTIKLKSRKKAFKSNDHQIRKLYKIKLNK